MIEVNYTSLFPSRRGWDDKSAHLSTGLWDYSGYSNIHQFHHYTHRKTDKNDKILDLF